MVNITLLLSLQFIVNDFLRRYIRISGYDIRRQYTRIVLIDYLSASIDNAMYLLEARYKNIIDISY